MATILHCVLFVNQNAKKSPVMCFLTQRFFAVLLLVAVLSCAIHLFCFLLLEVGPLRQHCVRHPRVIRHQ